MMGPTIKSVRRLLYHATLALGPFLFFLAIAGIWLDVEYEYGDVVLRHMYKYGASLCPTEALLPGLEYGLAVNYDDRNEVVGRVWRIDVQWLLAFLACYPVLTLVLVILNSLRRGRSRSSTATPIWRGVLHSICLSFSTVALVTLLTLAAADRVLLRTYVGSGGSGFELRDSRISAFVPIGQSDESATTMEWSWPPRESLFDRLDWIFVERVVSDYVFIAVDISLWPFAILLTLSSALALIRGPVRRAYRSRRGLCLNCGYDLRANISGRCPECGVPVGKPTSARM